MLKIDPVTADFVAEASGLDLRRPLSAAEAADIEAAMDRYAVLVWRDQPLSEAEHVAFAKMFGPLDKGLLGGTRKPSRFDDPAVVDIANVGVDGAVLARDHAGVTSSLANQFWHTDSSFHPTVAKYSMLSAQVVPDAGGDTEFADLRAACDALPPDLEALIRDRTGEHHALHSRMLLGNSYTDEQIASMPAVEWPLIRVHPGSGRRVLFVPAHIRRISGLSVPEGRMLIAELIEHATQPQFVHRHRWRVGDLVMWDNRCTLHRGRRFDLARRRELRRLTTIDATSLDATAGAAR